MRFRIILLMLVFAGYPAISLAAQIYKCKGENGKIVFQQNACGQDSVAGYSDAHKLSREMRVLSAEGRTILNSLGADIESIKQCNLRMENYQKKINALSRRVAKVAKNHRHLEAAYGYLKECSVCKTSAESNCIAADKELDKAISQLTEY